VDAGRICPDSQRFFHRGNATVWHDFHLSFMPLVREILTAQVLPRYFVQIDEQRDVREQSGEERRFPGRGDVLVSALSPLRTAAIATGALLEAPAALRTDYCRSILQIA
jgi:hypothetical protein